MASVMLNYLSVTSNLIMFPRDWCRLFVRVQISARRAMFQSYQVAVPNELNRIGTVPERHRLVELLDKPAVVSILMRIGSDLLLLSTYAGRVQVHVRMQIAAAGHAVLQSQERSVCHL